MDCQPSQLEDPQTLFTVKLNLASATFLVIFGLLLNTITVIIVLMWASVFHTYATFLLRCYYSLYRVIISIFAIIFNKMVAESNKKMKFLVYGTALTVPTCFFAYKLQSCSSYQNLCLHFVCNEGNVSVISSFTWQVF